MSRPEAIILASPNFDATKTGSPYSPKLLIVEDEESMARALDTCARGEDISILIELDEPIRLAFIDQLERVCQVIYERAGPTASRLSDLSDEQRALVELLRQGLSLDQAARTVALSRRTAARRLAEARTRLGLGTLAELLSFNDDDQPS